MSGPGDPGDGPVPEDTDSGEEPTTVFDDVDVEADVERDGRAPTGETLEPDEAGDIEAQVAEIVSSNRTRGPAEQVSVSPEDVN